MLLESLFNFYQKLFFYDEPRQVLKSSIKIKPVLENIEETSENLLDINEKNSDFSGKINIPSPKSFYLKESLISKAGDMLRKIKSGENKMLARSHFEVNKRPSSIRMLDESSILESSPHQLEASFSAKGQLLENFIAHLTPKNYVRVQKPNDFSPFDSERDTRLPTTANYSNHKDLLNYSQNKDLIHSFIEIQSQKKKSVDQVAKTFGIGKDGGSKPVMVPQGEKSISEFVLGNRKKPTIFHSRAMSTNATPQISFTQFLDTIFSKK